MIHFLWMKTFAGSRRLLRGMKKPMLVFLLVAIAAIPAHAELFRPSVVQGAVLGGIAGAVIGHNSGRHGGEGAAIGAVAGALIGAAVDRPEPRAIITAPPQVAYAPPAVYCPPPPPRVVHVYSAPVYMAAPVVVHRHAPATVLVYQRHEYRRPVYCAPVVHVHGGHGRHEGFGGGRWRR